MKPAGGRNRTRPTPPELTASAYGDIARQYLAGDRNGDDVYARYMVMHAYVTDIAAYERAHGPADQLTDTVLWQAVDAVITDAT